MRPTEILMEEHRLISQVLNCLEEMADRLVVEESLDTEGSRQVLDFFLNFAEGAHRDKEERHLFPLLETHDLPGLGPFLKAMRLDHENGRKLLEEMKTLLAGELTAASRRQLVHQVRTYIHLLRDHIYREDHHLLPLVDRDLSDQEQFLLLEAFAALDEGRSHEHYGRQAGALADRFKVSHLYEDFGEVTHAS